MRPLARTRLAWWDNLRAAAILAGVVVALIVAVLVLQWAGAIVVRFGIVAVAVAFAWTAQSRRVGNVFWLLALAVAGWPHV